MTKRFELYWISEDKQSSMPMGAFAPRQDAEDGIENAKKELLDAQGAEPWMAENVRRGSWEVLEEQPRAR